MKQLLLFLLLLSLPLCGSELTYSFSSGDWDAQRWIFVKSPRWNHFAKWKQQADYIQNITPEGVTKKELLSKLAPQTYSSMVNKQMFTGDIEISATLLFEDRMAPSIVLATTLGKSKTGVAEYREHFEIVLFDKGINVWHHVYENGKPHWKKAAYMTMELPSNKKYNLHVKIINSSKGRQLTIGLDGHRLLEYIDNSLPTKFYVGITGCEGVNRFYDFNAKGTFAK